MPATAAGLDVLAVATLSGDLTSNGFYTVPITGATRDVRPAGTQGSWNQIASAYVAPLSGNYALGTGPSNQDGEWVSWSIIWQTNGVNRKGHQQTHLPHPNAGEAVLTYRYLDGFGGTVGGEMSVELLHRD